MVLRTSLVHYMECERERNLGSDPFGPWDDRFNDHPRDVRRQDTGIVELRPQQLVPILTIPQKQLGFR